MATYSRVQMNPHRFHRSQIKFYIILLPVVAFMLLPIIYICSTAFKPKEEMFLFPPRLWVQSPSTDNFIDLFKQTKAKVPVIRYLVNSLLVTGVVMVFSVVLSSMAGFALSKLRFRGKRFWFEVNQLALMFVTASVAIPKYLVIDKLGLIDTIWAHILPIMAIPVGLFLVKQFVDQIPDSLIEAAHIDGANELMVYRRVVIPLTKPALSTLAILSFQTVWANMETSQYYINIEPMRTLAFYLNTFSGDTANATIIGMGASSAAALIMLVPNLIVFIVLQSQMMSTVAHSGIK